MTCMSQSRGLEASDLIINIKQGPWVILPMWWLNEHSIWKLCLLTLNFFQTENGISEISHTLALNLSPQPSHMILVVPTPCTTLYIYREKSCPKKYYLMKSYYIRMQPYGSASTTFIYMVGSLKAKIKSTQI